MSESKGGGFITLGMLLAFIISLAFNKSILLAVIHGLFSWIYVIYFFTLR